MSQLLPLLLFSISMMFTPGPNNLMILNSGLNYGIKRTLPHYFGVCFGFPLMLLIVALGFGAVFVKYEFIKQLLKIIGTLYLLYLAWKIATTTSASKVADSKPMSFIQGLLFQWVNPKAWLIAISAISIFSITANYFNNALVMCNIFLCVGFFSLGMWLFFGALLKRVLTEERHVKIFNMLMAILLVASIVTIFFD